MNTNEVINKLRMIEGGVLPHEEEKRIAGEVADFLSETESGSLHTSVVAGGLDEMSAAPDAVSKDFIERMVNGIGGGTWVNGALTLRQDELEQVIKGVANIAVRNYATPAASQPMPASVADNALDRPWQTYGNGHYEYIETICDAYESGIGDGLNGKTLNNPYGKANPDQGAAFEMGHVLGCERRIAALGSTEAWQVLMGAGVCPGTEPMSLAEGIRAAIAMRQSADSRHLANLLARIHRDGGHRQAEVGTEIAVDEADVLVANLNAEAAMHQSVSNRGGAEPVPTGLHAAIMNLPCNWKTADLSSITDAAIRAYQIGHRDARHAAAELASSRATNPATSEAAKQADQSHVMPPFGSVGNSLKAVPEPATSTSDAPTR